MHLGSHDFWDGNWLVSPLVARVGGFSAQIGAGLRAEELRGFRVDLQRLYERLDGEAVLASMEGWIRLTVRCKPNGWLAIQGMLHDQPGLGNALSFKVVGLDQTDVPGIVDSLIAVEDAYPVYGEP